MEKKIKQEKSNQNNKLVGKPPRLRVVFPRFINPHSTFSCSNWTFVNENLLRDPEHEVGFTESFLSIHRVRNVELMPNYIRYVLQQTLQPQVPLEYALDRLMSQTDKRCFQVAKAIQRINELYELNTQNIINHKFKPIEAVLEESANDKKLIFHGQFSKTNMVWKNIFVSHNLIKQLGYSVQQFSLACARLRTIISEVIDGDKYLDCLLAHLTCNLFHIELILGIGDRFTSQEQIQDCLNIKFFSKIQDKHNNTLYAYCRTYFPSPTIAVLQLLGVEARNPPFSNEKLKRIQVTDHEIERKQLQALYKIQRSRKSYIRAVPITLKRIEETSSNSESMPPIILEEGKWSNYERADRGEQIRQNNRGDVNSEDNE